MFKYAVPVCLAALSASAQVEMQRPYYNTAPHYYFQVLNFKSADSLSRMDFYFQIPHSRLHFIRTGSEFVSPFTISLRMIAAKDKTVFLDSWKETAICKVYDETVAEDILCSSQRHFTVTPGEYTLEVIVTEAETGESVSEARRLVARDYSLPGPSMSDVMILTASSVAGGKHVIVPNVRGNVVSPADSFQLFYEVYSGGRSPLYTTTTIAGKDNQILYSRRSMIPHGDAALRIFDDIPKSSLPMGQYSLTVRLHHSADDRSPALAAAVSRFSIAYPELPPTITDLDRAADQMMYIAGSSTIDSIKSSPDAAAKLEKFISFWRNYHSNFSPDGKTSMREYYNRVAYADKEFRHFFEGWKSDRGMIYILFGPPDNVERYPFNPDTKPYEIWHYYSKAHHFLFVDETGLGDYRLRNPIWSDNSPTSGMDFYRK